MVVVLSVTRYLRSGHGIFVSKTIFHVTYYTYESTDATVRIHFGSKFNLSKEMQLNQDFWPVRRWDRQLIIRHRLHINHSKADVIIERTKLSHGRLIIIVIACVSNNSTGLSRHWISPCSTYFTLYSSLNFFFSIRRGGSRLSRRNIEYEHFTIEDVVCRYAPREL